MKSSEIAAMSEEIGEKIITVCDGYPTALVITVLHNLADILAQNVPMDDWEMDFVDKMRKNCEK